MLVFFGSVLCLRTEFTRPSWLRAELGLDKVSSTSSIGQSNDCTPSEAGTERDESPMRHSDYHTSNYPYSEAISSLSRMFLIFITSLATQKIYLRLLFLVLINASRNGRVELSPHIHPTEDIS